MLARHYLRHLYAGVVDICLIPEVKFELGALTQYVKEVMKRKGHCVVCIAEGAGQDIVQHGHTGTDKSGNPILKDIGTHLRDVFKESIQVCLQMLSHAASCYAILRFLWSGQAAKEKQRHLL